MAKLEWVARAGGTPTTPPLNADPQILSRGQLPLRTRVIEHDDKPRGHTWPRKASGDPPITG
jgi:hypothetical protein